MNGEFRMTEKDLFDEIEDLVNQLSEENDELKEENKELKQRIEVLEIEIAELRESENDNYNISDGLW